MGWDAATLGFSMRSRPHFQRIIIRHLFFNYFSLAKKETAYFRISVFVERPRAHHMAVKRDYDYLFKLVLIGDSSVGKSCLLLRFAVSHLVHTGGK